MPQLSQQPSGLSNATGSAAGGGGGGAQRQPLSTVASSDHGGGRASGAGSTGRKCGVLASIARMWRQFAAAWSELETRVEQKIPDGDRARREKKNGSKPRVPPTQLMPTVASTSSAPTAAASGGGGGGAGGSAAGVGGGSGGGGAGDGGGGAGAMGGGGGGGGSGSLPGVSNLTSAIQRRGVRSAEEMAALQASLYRYVRPSYDMITGAGDTLHVWYAVWHCAVWFGLQKV